MKLSSFLVFSLLLFSCKKDTNSGNPRREEIAIAQTQVISSQTSNHIVKDTTVAAKRIFTYDNGAVMELTPTKIVGQWNAVVKMGVKSMPFVYKETAFTDYTLCTYQSSTGVVYSNFKVIQKTGQIIDAVFINEMPVNLLGNYSARLTLDCVRQALNICIHSKLCYVLCTAGGWGGCLFGWSIGCM